MRKYNVHLYNCVELDFSNLTKEDYKVTVSRQMAPIYTMGDTVINQFKTATSIIMIEDYKNKIDIDLNIKEYGFRDFSEDQREYDNIYFKDFVLTDCFLVEMEGKLYVLSKKVTLI